jgi:hypothetical protein
MANCPPGNNGSVRLRLHLAYASGLVDLRWEGSYLVWPCHNPLSLGMLDVRSELERLPQMLNVHARRTRFKISHKLASHTKRHYINIRRCSYVPCMKMQVLRPSYSVRLRNRHTAAHHAVQSRAVAFSLSVERSTILYLERGTSAKLL